MRELSLAQNSSQHRHLQRPISAGSLVEPQYFSLFWGSLFVLASWLGKVLLPWEPECGELAGLPGSTGSSGMPGEAVATFFLAQRRPSQPARGLKAFWPLCLALPPLTVCTTKCCPNRFLPFCLLLPVDRVPWPVGRAEHVDPVSGTWVVAQRRDHCVATWEPASERGSGETCLNSVSQRIGGCGAQHLLVPLPGTGEGPPRQSLC